MGGRKLGIISQQWVTQWLANREISPIEVKERRICGFVTVTLRIWGRFEIQDSHSCDFSCFQALACALCLMLSRLLAGYLPISSPQSPSLELSLSISFSTASCLLQAGLGSIPLCPPEVLFSSLACCFVTTYLIASPPPPSSLAVSLLGHLLEWELRFTEYLQLARHCARRVLSIILINLYTLPCEVDFIIFILWMGKWWLRDIK